MSDIIRHRMANDRAAELRHICKAPTRSGEFVPLRVLPMTLAHARWWQRYIQPWIDQSQDPRADRGWRWPRIYATTQLVGGLLRQRPNGLVAGVTRGAEILPVCMALLVERYPYLPEPSQDSVFLWYATRCPDKAIQSALRIHPESVPKRLMEITLDMAVTQSFRGDMMGRTSLHADNEGGDALCQKYESFGMLRLPQDRPLPTGSRHVLGNDGRYYYHSEESALAASRRLDVCR